ncbi:F0F1 ATP synthase subunit A, partial [Dialister invisus]|uniref:F0F1 ATP synthase subunit A n=1 Tax=Dialister invisus TaxID=218538 RepID=UPI002583EB78
FIFLANEIGLLPTAHLTASPTNDVNTTLGLALTGTLCIHFVYIRNRGFGKWLKHFFEPMPPFVIINIVEE